MDVNARRELAAAIRWWNHNSGFHPLTCGKDSRHEYMILNGDTWGLICPTCGWTQSEVPDFVLDAYRRLTGEAMGRVVPRKEHG